MSHKFASFNLISTNSYRTCTATSKSRKHTVTSIFYFPLWHLCISSHLKWKKILFLLLLCYISIDLGWNISFMQRFLLFLSFILSKYSVWDPAWPDDDDDDDGDDDDDDDDKCVEHQSLRPALPQRGWRPASHVDHCRLCGSGLHQNHFISHQHLGK